jgi:hypothetical protein
MATQINSAQTPSETVKGVVTILLALHLLAVGTMIFGYHRPGSQLMFRADSLVLPYTQTLHLDPVFAKLELTTGDGFGENHLLDVQLLPPIDSSDDRPIKTLRLPGDESRWGLAHRRWQAIANDGSAFAKSENEGVAIAYAAPILNRILLENQASRARIHFVFKKVPPLNPTTEPELPADDFRAPAYFETQFTAEGWFDGNNRLQIQQVNLRRQIAPPPGTPRSPDGKE